MIHKFKKQIITILLLLLLLPACTGRESSVPGDTGDTSAPQVMTVAPADKPSAIPPEGAGDPSGDTVGTADRESITVYVTNWGECYHEDGCQCLNVSKIPVLLDEVDRDKYAPCSICCPPVLD